MNFYTLMRKIPDVCRVWTINGVEGEEVLIERVSTEESSHMDALTIVKKKKTKPLSRFRFVRCHVLTSSEINNFFQFTA